MFFKTTEKLKKGVLVPSATLASMVGMKHPHIFLFINRGDLNVVKIKGVRCTFVVFDEKFKAFVKARKEKGVKA